MTNLPDYKLNIIVDALLALEAEFLNATIAGDDLAAAEDMTGEYDEGGEDIQADLREIHRGISKARRAASNKKYAQSERGKSANAAARKTWRQ